jgi:hypothetical protein
VTGLFFLGRKFMLKNIILSLNLLLPLRTKFFIIAGPCREKIYYSKAVEDTNICYSCELYIFTLKYQ